MKNSSKYIDYNPYERRTILYLPIAFFVPLLAMFFLNAFIYPLESHTRVLDTFIFAFLTFVASIIFWINKKPTDKKLDALEPQMKQSKRRLIKLVYSWPIKLLILTLIYNLLLTLFTKSPFTQSIIYPSLIFWIICYILPSIEQNEKETVETMSMLTGLPEDEINKIIDGKENKEKKS
jgi:amino acid permease